MTKLVWDKAANRRYDYGVEKGVFYPPEGPGVAWYGLASVVHARINPSLEPIYFEGARVALVPDVGEFEATISAFATPEKFDIAQGTIPVISGFYVTRQQKTSFGMSYRTLAEEGHYKIHLVYNATAAPSSRAYSTMGETNELAPFSWKISAVPDQSLLRKPAAHFILDSRLADPDALALVESILHGDAENDARLPPPGEIREILNGGPPSILMTNHSTNPSFEKDVSGWSAHGNAIDPFADAIRYDSGIASMRVQRSASPSSNYAAFRNLLARGEVEPGKTYRVRLRMFTVESNTDITGIRIGGDVDYPRDHHVIGPYYEWHDAELPFTVLPNATQVFLYIRPGGTTYTWVDSVMIVESEDPLPPYFDGDTPETYDHSYEWLGAPGDSKSVKKGWS